MSELIPRLSSAEMPPDLAEYLRPRVERLGYLGEFFQCSAHQPRVLLAFMRFTEELKAALPDNLSEVVALTVSCLMGNAYERVQHERLSLKLEFAEAWIRDVENVAPAEAASMKATERAVQALVIAAIDSGGHGAREELGAAIAAIGHEQAIAVLMLIGRYMTHALIVNALALQPPVRSPLGAQ
jgi:alkylhydroperoxidase family enzyme